MRAELDRTLAALADPSRRAIVERLRARPLQPSQVAAALAISRPAISRHLRVLRRAGLVVEERHDGDARVHLYHLRRERFRELAEWVTEVESFWTEQLGAFKAHAEARGATPRRAAKARR